MSANRMRERGIEDYRLIERLHDFGGVWHTHSNNYSTLQVHNSSNLSQQSHSPDTQPMLAGLETHPAVAWPHDREPKRQYALHSPSYSNLKIVLTPHRHQRQGTGSCRRCSWGAKGPWSRQLGMLC